MLRLTPTLTAELLRAPETGMGYQVVSVEFREAVDQRAIAYNAELLVFENELSRLSRESYDRLLREAESALDVVSLRVLRSWNEWPLANAQTVREGAPPYARQGASEAVPEAVAADETFKRFSAYSNDRRVTGSGGLAPGTYATTAEDAMHVQTGRQAVARYALPNPQPASFVFTIRPPGDTLIQRGIVQPAFGQPGGGVEVIFTMGSPDKTATGPMRIADG